MAIVSFGRIPLYSQLQHRLVDSVREFLRRQYDIELANIVAEQPPKVEMGEYALPLSFELAKKLRKAPRKIAEEIVAGLGEIEGFEKLEVAGAGYINARVKRGEAAAALTEEIDSETDPHLGPHLPKTGRYGAPEIKSARGKRFWSSTPASIPTRPRTSATCAMPSLATRSCGCCGRRDIAVDVQNYIDNTGVQVADVVVGFTHAREEIEGRDRATHRRNAAFDLLCWDLYARVSRWYEEDKGNLTAATGHVACD